LHWDIVDMLPTETATLTLEYAVEGGLLKRTELPCVTGSFSSPLPPVDQPLKAAAVRPHPRANPQKIITLR
jgi:hypothetical protein